MYTRLPMATASADSNSKTGSSESGQKMADAAVYHLLVIGRSGSGKSAVGNLVLGNDIFDTHSRTTKITTGHVSRDGRDLKVMDTPDISTETSMKKRQEMVAEWKKFVSEGPSAILVVVKWDKDCDGDNDTYCEIKDLWGNDHSFLRRLIVVLNEKNAEEEEQMSMFSDALQAMKDAYNKEFVIFNAKRGKDATTASQILALAAKIISPPILHICLMGKTGNGKSSTGNTLLGKELFTARCGLCPSTAELETLTESLSEKRTLTVFDTPAVSVNDLTEDAVSTWKNGVCKKPCAVLLVVRCDVRYTAEEYAIYKKIKELWGDKSLCERLVVAFTFWDRQKSDIEKELNTTVPQELKNVLKDASNRYVVFNNSDNRPCLSEEQEEVGGDSLIVFSRGDSQLEREQKIHRLFARLDGPSRPQQERERRTEEQSGGRITQMLQSCSDLANRTRRSLSRIKPTAGNFYKIFQNQQTKTEEEENKS